MMDVSELKVSLKLDDTTYIIDPRSVKLAEPNRYICRAWKMNPKGDMREVLNLGTLDRLGCKWTEAHENGQSSTR